MPWVVNSIDGQQSYPALAGKTLYLVAGDAGLSAVYAIPVDPALILGTLGTYICEQDELSPNSHNTAVQSYGAKLEAGNDDLNISPAGPARVRKNGSGDPPAEGFLLQAKTDKHVETTVIRNQDRITSKSTSGTLTLVWTPPQIQVQSSEKKNSPAESGEVVQAEDETENDDEDLDNTVVPGVTKSQTMRSTPHMSASRSEIIQETPTIDRVGDVVGLPSRTGPPTLKEDDSTTTAAAPQKHSIVNDLTKPEEPTDTEMEDDNVKSKAPDTVLRQSTRHSKVQISKRPSPALEETSSPSTRTAKRRKVDKDSDSTTPVQTARKTAAKGKKRESVIKAESTPSRSQRSTQSSTAGSPVNVEGEYDGPKPRVVLSNSTIQLSSSFVKFLKKNGGNIVDSVEDDCNILW
jgi:hypothetical protein